MRVAAIYIAPVKSLRLQQLDRAAVHKRGLAGDREFFLVNDRNRLFTMREFGPLGLINARYLSEEQSLRFEFPDGTSVEAKPEPGDPITARFFGEYDVEASEVPGPWDRALTDYVGMPLKLARATGKRSGVDALPVSLLSDASVAALREHSGEATFEERRFRPNVWISGAERPHQEDEWVDSDVRIGSAIIRVRMRDPRCVMTTLNPDSGERDFNTLRMITAYRTDQPKEANFGVYGTVTQEGEIAVGDSIEIATDGST